MRRGGVVGALVLSKMIAVACVSDDDEQPSQPDAGQAENDATFPPADASGIVDASRDSAIVDATIADTATSDTSIADTATRDTSIADTAVTDTSIADTAVTDTSIADVGADTFDAFDSADALYCVIPPDASADASDAGAPQVGTLCGASCVDIESDPSHCGSCANACEAGATCAAGQCLDVVGALEGLSWTLPCDTSPSGGYCNCTDPPPQVATVQGAAGATYDVTLHFRGIVEQKTYDAIPDAGVTPSAAGTNAAMFSTAVTSFSDGWNVYSLTISDPPQVAYLNVGVSNQAFLWPIDYTVTLPMKVGATVTLAASSDGGSEVSNQGSDGGALVVPGFFDAGAFDGQFVEMDVANVAVH